MSERTRKRRLRRRERKEWVQQMAANNKATPQFCFEVLRTRYPDRVHDYGPIAFYGPFSDQELDDCGIAHNAIKTSDEEHWLSSMATTATNEELMQSFTHFIKDMKRAWWLKRKGIQDVES